MRISKRILALVLALVMVLTMAPFAGAANLIDDMNDVDEISARYLTAAGVLVGLGVFQGEDGNFMPQRDITRAEMTAVLFRLVNGPVAVPQGDGSTFADVVPGSGTYWARHYIGWAEGEGLVVGVGGGRFEPGRPVTGIEASIMLLRALGYGVRGEFQGEGWAQRAFNQALTAGLLTNLDSSVALADPAHREVIAQLGYNTLDADRVQWNAAAEMYVPDPLLNPLFISVFGLRKVEDVTLPNAGDRVNVVSGMFPNAAGNLVFTNNITVDRRPTQQQHRTTILETGRVANVYFVDGTASAFTTMQVIYIAITSTDVRMGRNATALATLNAIENVGGRNLDRGTVFIYPDFTRTGAAIDTDAGAGVTAAARFGANLSALFNLGGDNNARWPATYVIFDGELISVIWGSGQVRNMTINANDIASSQVRLQGLSPNTVDVEYIISSEIPLDETFTGFANVFNVGPAGPNREYIITEVQSFEGTVHWVEEINTNRVNFGIQTARAPMWTFVTGPVPGGGALPTLDTANLVDASRLSELNDVESAAALRQNIGRDFVFYIDGATGQVVAAYGRAEGAAPATRAVVVVEPSVEMVVNGAVRPHARVISSYTDEIEIIRLANPTSLGAGAQRGDVLWVTRDTDDIYTLAPAIVPPAAVNPGTVEIDTNNTAATLLPGGNRIETTTRFVYLNATQAGFVASGVVGVDYVENPSFSRAVGPHAGTIAAGAPNLSFATRDGSPDTVFVWANHDGDGVGEVLFVRGAGDNLGADGWRFRVFDYDGSPSSATVAGGRFITLTGTGNNAQQAVNFQGEGFYRVSADGARLIPVTTMTNGGPVSGNDRRFAIGTVDTVDLIDNFITFVDLIPMTGGLTDSTINVDNVTIIGRNNMTMTLTALNDLTGIVNIAVSLDTPTARNAYAIWVLPATFNGPGNAAVNLASAITAAQATVTAAQAAVVAAGNAVTDANNELNTAGTGIMADVDAAGNTVAAQALTEYADVGTAVTDVTNAIGDVNTAITAVQAAITAASGAGDPATLLAALNTALAAADLAGYQATLAGAQTALATAVQAFIDAVVAAGYNV